MAHRVELADQVVAFMLHHAAHEKPSALALDALAIRPVAGCSELRAKRGTTPRMPGHRQAAFPAPSSSASPCGVICGLISTVSGTAGASG